MIHDARITVHLRPLLKEREQLFGEQKVRQVIGLHLHIKPVTGRLVGHRHDAGVVHQRIHAGLSAHITHQRGGLSDRGEALEVAGQRADAPRPKALFEPSLDGVGARRRPVEHQHLSARLGEGHGGDFTRPRRRPCHHKALALKRGQLRDQIIVITAGNRRHLVGHLLRSIL